MRLVIGGFAQGKLACVLRNLQLGEDAVARALPLPDGAQVLDGLHTLVAGALQRGEDPEPAVWAAVERCPALTIVCDELGCGVVPVDAFERAWRERVGRLCCALAARAETVVRVFCGLPAVIKGDERWS